MVVAIVCLIGIKITAIWEFDLQAKGKKPNILVSFRQIVCLVWNTKGLETIWCLPLLQQMLCGVRMPGACRGQTWDSFLHGTWQVAVTHQVELMCFRLEFVLEIGWDFRHVERLSLGPLAFPCFLKSCYLAISYALACKEGENFCTVLVNRFMTDT